MRVTAMQLNTNTRPLMNHSYINTDLRQYRMFTIEINKSHSAITVRHEEKGTYTVPIGSVSWYKLAIGDDAHIVSQEEMETIKVDPQAAEQMKKLLDLPGPPKPINKGNVVKKKAKSRAKPRARAK